VDFAKVVKHEMDRDGVSVHLGFLAEAVCESREPAHVHPHREVLTFNVCRGDVLLIRGAADECALGAGDLRRRVAHCGALARKLHAVMLLKCGEVDLYAERVLHSVQVELQVVRRHLHAVRETGSYVLHELVRVICCAIAHAVGDDQFGVRVNRGPRPDVAPFGFLLGWNVALFRSDERPDFIALNATGLQVANVSIVVGSAGGAQVANELFNRHSRHASHASRAPEAVAFHKAVDDLGALFRAQPVHVSSIRERASKSSSLNIAPALDSRNVCVGNDFDGVSQDGR